MKLTDKHKERIKALADAGDNTYQITTTLRDEFPSLSKDAINITRRHVEDALGLTPRQYRQTHHYEGQRGRLNE